MKHFTAASIQLTTTNRLDENLAQAGALIGEAARSGAGLVLLPENFAFMGEGDRDKLALMEADGHGPIQDFLAGTAQKHRLWLAAGSAPLRSRVPGKIRAACLVYGPDGDRLYRYDKIHLFDVDVPGSDETYRESDTIDPGDEPGLIQTPLGQIGIAICYDIRFPEYTRLLSERGMEILLVPAAFTARTGAAHWEILLRARAIENQCYVIAANQGGSHPGGRETFGHSMIVDPWGQILDRLEQAPGVCGARLDADTLKDIRSRFPTLAHRRFH